MFHSVKLGTITMLSGWFISTLIILKASKEMKGPDFTPCLRCTKLVKKKKTNLSLLCMIQKKTCMILNCFISAKANVKTWTPKRGIDDIGDSDLWLVVASHGFTICISGGAHVPSVALLRINEASSGPSLRFWSSLEHSEPLKLAKPPSILSTAHIRQALLQPAKSIW